MVKIFSVTPSYEILIEDRFVVRCDDEFISIELPAGLNWHQHAQSCTNCKAFLSSFGKATYQWNMFAFEQYYRLDLIGFGKLDNYSINLSRFESSKDFWGTKLRLKIIEINTASLEALLLIKIEEQQYERCAELRDNIKFLNKG